MHAVYASAVVRAFRGASVRLVKILHRFARARRMWLQKQLVGGGGDSDANMTNTLHVAAAGVTHDLWREKVSCGAGWGSRAYSFTPKWSGAGRKNGTSSCNFKLHLLARHKNRDICHRPTATSGHGVLWFVGALPLREHPTHCHNHN
eukprot:scaffold235772_cov36-Tisochrysis_lutea.AAC.1